jgi:hypothetical protein
MTLVDLDTRRRHAVQAFDSHLQQLRPATFEQTGGVAQLKLDVDAIALQYRCARIRR